MAKRKAPAKQPVIEEEALGAEATPAESAVEDTIKGLYAVKLQLLAGQVESMHIEEVKARLFQLAQELDG